VVQSIGGVLEDEGFRVLIAKNGEEAIHLFQTEEPDVTLIDIWMPGMDGIEVLKRLKGFSPECLVIMISGHATISTAMAAVKFGAFDFIEKPLSLDLLLLTIHRALDRQKEFSGFEASEDTGTAEFPPGDKAAFSKEIPEGFIESSMPASRKTTSASPSLQRTLKRSMVLYGTGLHSGMKTGLLLQPLPPNSGILFGSISYEDVVPAHLDYVQSTEFATALKKGRASAMTIEHHGCPSCHRITNLMAKMIRDSPWMAPPWVLKDDRMRGRTGGSVEEPILKTNEIVRKCPGH
jgi:CheY-like chemotaxis protein